MLLFYCLLFFLIFLLFSNRILQLVLLLVLKTINLKLEIPSYSHLKDIFFFFHIQGSILKKIVCIISSIKLIKIRNIFEYVVEFEKINLKAEITNLELSECTSKDFKKKELFASNLLKIINFIFKVPNHRTNPSKKEKQPGIKETQKMSKLLSDFFFILKVYMQFVLLSVMTKISFRFKKIGVEIINAENQSNETMENVKNRFERKIGKFLIYDLNIKLTYNFEVIKKAT